MTILLQVTALLVSSGGDVNISGRKENYIKCLLAGSIALHLLLSMDNVKNSTDSLRYWNTLVIQSQSLTKRVMLKYSQPCRIQSTETKLSKGEISEMQGTS
ncbi:hypothetical protein EV426DRAFT_580341, partial [Tirmania nivea]